MAADLLGERNSIRILKDAVFAQTVQGDGAGFHIDDKAFWPAENDATGVNFWIALSDYNTATGGGIRVAPQSHSAEWGQTCRNILLDAHANYEMGKLSSECEAKLANVSVVHDMQPGDALLWDRWIFHRQEPFKEAAENVHKLRYTIRYIPSHARAAVDGLLHPSVELGKPFLSPYHPQAWPRALEDEMKTLQQGLGSDLSFVRVATLIKKSLMKKYFEST
jgi:hypothetical protein